MSRPILFFFVALSFAQTVAGDDAQWIGPPRVPVNDASGEAFLLGKTFTVDRPVDSAELRVAADFCRVKVRLNGRMIDSIAPYGLAVPIDVTRATVEGANRIEMTLRDTYGPAAIAVELTIETAEGRESLWSDGSWTQGSKPVRTYGPVTVEPWWSVVDRPSTNAFDEYNQWRDARTVEGAESAKLELPDGFEIETVYRVPASFGSWISMARDPNGRIYAGTEKQGVFRLTFPRREEPKLPTVELVNEKLKGCHGMVWKGDSLFVNASDDRKLYRLRDANNDGQFETTLLREIPGRGGDHGRNDLTVGPNGEIYSIHGDAVEVPDGFTSLVPVTHEFEDGRPRGGHLVRTDSQGSKWQVVASGLRNPYGMAINRDGEMFTYDADSERHWGLPWYRPTRMNHLVPGTDYGWRSREGLPWPTYHADILPPNVLIGRGSPTSLKFGYASHFPAHYREALFAPDWSFGRLFAVHVVPRGASYSMHPETFLRGRPLNICDIEFEQDGSMLLLTGGYGTRSVLYRMCYTGPREEKVLSTQQMADREKASSTLRKIRRMLESLQREDPTAVDSCWEYLDHHDRWIRHAARVALEHQPVEKWQERLWNESRVDRWLPATLAIVRIGKPRVRRTWRRLAEVPLNDLAVDQRMVVVRIAQWLDEYHEAPTGDASEPAIANSRNDLLAHFEKIYPTGDAPFDREVCSWLSRHGSDVVVQKTLKAVARKLSQNDRLHLLQVLSTTTTGWTPSARAEFFRLLQAARLALGDESMPRFLEELEENALKSLPASLAKDEREQLTALLAHASEEEEVHATPRRFVRKWTLEDLARLSVGSAKLKPSKRKPTDGKAVPGERIFREARCARCHRVGTIGRSMGPDLTGLGARFSRRDIVEAIVDPSKSVSSRFENHLVVTTDGKSYTGQVVWNGFRKSTIRLATDPERLDQFVEISKHDIELQRPAGVSPMPAGLLDSFDREEIESLLAFLMAGQR